MWVDFTVTVAECRFHELKLCMFVYFVNIFCQLILLIILICSIYFVYNTSNYCIFPNVYFYFYISV